MINEIRNSGKDKHILSVGLLARVHHLQMFASVFAALSDRLVLDFSGRFQLFIQLLHGFHTNSSFSLLDFAGGAFRTFNSLLRFRHSALFLSLWNHQGINYLNFSTLNNVPSYAQQHYPTWQSNPLCSSYKMESGKSLEMMFLLCECPPAAFSQLALLKALRHWLSLGFNWDFKGNGVGCSRHGTNQGSAKGEIRAQVRKISKKKCFSKGKHQGEILPCLSIIMLLQCNLWKSPTPRKAAIATSLNHCLYFWVHPRDLFFLSGQPIAQTWKQHLQIMEILYPVVKRKKLRSKWRMKWPRPLLREPLLWVSSQVLFIYEGWQTPILVHIF